MKSVIVFVFFIVAASCEPFCKDNCRSNEVYTACGGAGMCQKNCMTRNIPNNKVCDCENGCQCKPGFIRDHRFICIPNNQCPALLPAGNKKCPANEVFSDCMAGCQKTCNTLDIAFKCKCVEGCVCNEGYVRSDITNLCVLVNECKCKDFI